MGPKRVKSSFRETLQYVPAISWAVLTLILFASIGGYYTQSRFLRLQRESNEAEAASFVQRTLESAFEPIASDLVLIADDPTLRPFLDKPSPQTRDAFTARLLWWSKHEKDYYEIRLLDSTGQETVRVNYHHGEPHLVPEGELQDKSQRYFFTDSIKLGAGDVFVSQLDLNVDRGAIEQPLHPTIRMCTPVFDGQGRKQGVLMLNYEAREFLGRFRENPATSIGELLLVNAEGYWLKGRNPEDEWGFMFDDGKGKTLESAFPFAWAQISQNDSGAFYDRDGLFVFRTIHFRSGANRFQQNSGATAFRFAVGSPYSFTGKVISYVPAATVMAGSRRLASQIALITMVLCVPVVLASWSYARARMRRSLTESQLQQQSTLLDLAEDAIYVVDRAYRFHYWNHGAQKLYGWTSEEVLGRDGREVLQTRFPKPIQDIESELFRTGRWEGEIARTSRDGEEIVSLSRWALQRDAAGDASFILIINHDITARKLAEDGLRQAHKETELFLNAIPSLLIGLDCAGRVVRWNPAAETVFGVSHAEAFGKALGACGVQWIEREIDSALETGLSAEGTCRLEKVRFARSGETRFASITALRLKGGGDVEAGILLVGADITDLIALETQLRQAQKLEAIGQLAAGIAHEINTPIQYVGDNTMFLRESWAEINALLEACERMRQEAESGVVSGATLADVNDRRKASDLEYLLKEVPRAFEQSLDGVQRVAKIVRAMKEFSHPGSEEKKLTDINGAIETTVTVARNEWKYVAELETRLDSGLPMVPCFGAELNQVILNLIVNAAHAIAERSGTASRPKGKIEISTLASKECVEIRVQDNGSGIPENIQSRIFEPFFTTKEVGKGTGQGLAMAHAIVVKKHGGNIWFESIHGKGTTFFIRLPLALGRA